MGNNWMGQHWFNLVRKGRGRGRSQWHKCMDRHAPDCLPFPAPQPHLWQAGWSTVQQLDGSILAPGTSLQLTLPAITAGPSNGGLRIVPSWGANHGGTPLFVSYRGTDATVDPLDSSILVYAGERGSAETQHTNSRPGERGSGVRYAGERVSGVRYAGERGSGVRYAGEGGLGVCAFERGWIGGAVRAALRLLPPPHSSTPRPGQCRPHQHTQHPRQQHVRLAGQQRGALCPPCGATVPLRGAYLAQLQPLTRPDLCRPPNPRPLQYTILEVHAPGSGRGQAFEHM